MADKSKHSLGFITLLLGFFMGASFLTFLGKSKGKDLRKELLKNWEDGDNLISTKFKIVMREFLGAVTELKPALDEFMASPKTKSEVAKGKKVVKKATDTGKKAVEKTVKAGKKKAAKVLREVSGMEKKVVKKIKGKKVVKKSTTKK